MTPEQQRKAYVEMSLHGTPKDVLEKLRARREILGHPFDMCALVDVGDMPFSVARDCVEMIGREIVPIIHNWDLECRDRGALAPAAE